jgi:hypothetical protein
MRVAGSRRCTLLRANLLLLGDRRRCSADSSSSGSS